VDARSIFDIALKHASDDISTEAPGGQETHLTSAHFGVGWDLPPEFPLPDGLCPGQLAVLKGSQFLGRQFEAMLNQFLPDAQMAEPSRPHMHPTLHKTLFTEVAVGLQPVEDGIYLRIQVGFGFR